jgi:hypothetical protein
VLRTTTTGSGDRGALFVTRDGRTWTLTPIA